MELEIFTLADYAVNSGNGKLTIVGTFDTLWSQQVPTQQFCSVVLKMRLANSEAGMHQIKLKFIDTEGKEFIPGPVFNIEHKVNQNADYSSIPVIMNLSPLNLNKRGIYAIEFYFDGEFHSGLKLTLIHNDLRNFPKVA